MEDNKFKRRILTLGTQQSSATITTKRSGMPIDFANLKKKGIVRDQESKPS